VWEKTFSSSLWGFELNSWSLTLNQAKSSFPLTYVWLFEFLMLSRIGRKTLWSLWICVSSLVFRKWQIHMRRLSSDSPWASSWKIGETWPRCRKSLIFRFLIDESFIIILLSKEKWKNFNYFAQLETSVSTSFWVSLENSTVRKKLGLPFLSKE